MDTSDTSALVEGTAIRTAAEYRALEGEPVADNVPTCPDHPNADDCNPAAHTLLRVASLRDAAPDPMARRPLTALHLSRQTLPWMARHALRPFTGSWMTPYKWDAAIAEETDRYGTDR